MKDTDRISRIVRRIHPEIYPIDASPGFDSDSGFDCLFIQKRLLGRRAFAMMDIGSRDLQEAIGYARKKVQELTGAVWCFREVGLYLVLHGREDLWCHSHQQIHADKTGLHSVIIQGIHFIDLDSGAFAIKQSKWGPCAFGDRLLPIAVSPSIK